MLSLGKRKPLNTDLFQIPFTGAVSWSLLVEMYPDVVQEMNGECRENCLLFYYNLNPVTKVYEFRDGNSELDFAEILKIDLNVTIEGESKEDYEDRKNKSYNDLFNNFLNEETKIIKHKSCDELTSINFKQQKEELKKAKKERRAQKLLEREKLN